jgi:chromosome segregation ATPase
MMLALLITLTGLAAVALGYQTYALRRAQRGTAALEENLSQLHERVQQLEQELGALCSASVGAGEHVVRLEQQVRRIVERQNHLEMRASVEQPYSHASQLVTRGADIDELVETCGLTRGEAELLVMMQRGAA